MTVILAVYFILKSLNTQEEMWTRVTCQDSQITIEKHSHAHPRATVDLPVALVSLLSSWVLATSLEEHPWVRSYHYILWCPDLKSVQLNQLVKSKRNPQDSIRLTWLRLQNLLILQPESPPSTDGREASWVPLCSYVYWNGFCHSGGSFFLLFNMITRSFPQSLPPFTISSLCPQSRDGSFQEVWAKGWASRSG